MNEDIGGQNCIVFKLYWNYWPGGTENILQHWREEKKKDLTQPLKILQRN